MKFFRKVVPSTFITFLLLLSFNLNVFALDYKYMSFANCDFTALWNNSEDVGSSDFQSTNVTSSTTRTYYGDISTVSGYTGGGYTLYTLPTVAGAHRNIITITPTMSLYLDSTYKFHIRMKFGDVSGFTSDFILWIFYSNDAETEGAQLTLVDMDNIASNTWLEFSGEFSIPNGNYTKYSMWMQIANDKGTVSSVRKLYIGDFGYAVYNSTYDDVIVPDNPSDDIDDTLNDYDDAISQLPTIDSSDIDEALSFSSLADFVPALEFIRILIDGNSTDVDDGLLGVTGLNGVLAFALGIGLVTFVIGRKVG